MLVRCASGPLTDTKKLASIDRTSGCYQRILCWPKRHQLLASFLLAGASNACTQQIIKVVDRASGVVLYVACANWGKLTSSLELNPLNCPTPKHEEGGGSGSDWRAEPPLRLDGRVKGNTAYNQINAEENSQTLLYCDNHTRIQVATKHNTHTHPFTHKKRKRKEKKGTACGCNADCLPGSACRVDPQVLLAQY